MKLKPFKYDIVIMTNTSINALVTGANGFIGSHLVDYLLKQNIHVTILARKNSNLQWLNKNRISIIYTDINELNIPAPILAKQHYIYHCAGLVRAIHETDFFKTNHDATKTLIQQVSKHCKHLKKFIFLSSLEAGGPSPDNRIRQETDPDNPVTSYGKSKLMAEKTLLSYKNTVPIIIIRPPLVYGPRDSGLLEFAKSIKAGFGVYIGQKTQYVSAIFIDDLINALYTCSHTPLPSGNIFYLSDQSTPHTWKSLHHILKTKLNKKIHIPLKLPPWLFWLICQTGDCIQKATKKVSWINKTRYITLTQTNWSCIGKKLHTATAFSPKTSIENGLETTLKWYKKHNWIR